MVLTITFKTREPFFSKEESGDKSNTVRSVYGGNDNRFDDIMEIIQHDDYGGRKDKIRIINPQEDTYFERVISDITYYDDRFIISWIHDKTQTKKLEDNA